MKPVACSLKKSTDLSDREIEAWHDILQANIHLRSPYFSPAFSQAVGSIRQDTEIAIWRSGDEIKAFFPFHRRPGNIGKPISGPLSDYHAIIANKEFEFSPKSLLADCHLNALDFSNWLECTLPENACIRSTEPARYLDLTQGFEYFVQERANSGVRELKKTFKKKRKIIREVGALRLVHDQDSEVLWSALFDWKKQQYQRTNVIDMFDIPWVAKVLEAIRRCDTPTFKGALSGLYAGDTLIAVHFGMRTDKVWHYWYPTHNPDFGKYSPGMLLCLEIAEYAANLGLDRIDLGKGSTRFKTSLGSSSIDLSQGFLLNHSMRSKLRSSRMNIEQLSQRLPIGTFSTWPKKLFARIDRSQDLRD